MEQICLLKKKVGAQEKKISNAEQSLKNATSCLLSFLSEEQKEMLSKQPSQRKEWSQQSVIIAMKMRYALGCRGYNYLRNTGYPLPSVSTLNRRLEALSFDFGLLHSILPYLKEKVETMKEEEKHCVIIFDEMFIDSSLEFEKSKRCNVGHVTLGKAGEPGNHLLIGMVRGLSTVWKQIIAHEITGSSTSGNSMKKFVLDMIKACQDVGLKPQAIISDMGAANKALWNSLNVEVSRNVRKTSFLYQGCHIHVFADIPHLLKNLRSALLKGDLILPENVVATEGLPSNVVSFQCIKNLWLKEHEDDNRKKTKLLYHLTEKHVLPNHFQVMTVSLGVDFFSLTTAAGLETAVRLKMIPPESLTTAWFVRLVTSWFEMMTARHRKITLTAQNFGNKKQFLEDFVDIVQNIKIGKGWKPIQTGIILSTLSMINLVQECLKEGYSYVLTGRVNQDVLENTFSVLRQRAGKIPTALKCRQGVKLLSVSQFLADTPSGNYVPDRDTHLLQLIRDARKSSGPDDKQESLMSEHPMPTLSPAEKNNVYFIAGSCLKAASKSLCSECKKALSLSQAEVEMKEEAFLTLYQNCGGLSFPSKKYLN